MTETFRSDGKPPAWCELTGFKLFTLEGVDPLQLRRRAARERLVVTASAVQVSFGGRSQVFSERQFFDLPEDIDEYLVTPVRVGAQVVVLTGHWGGELGGCGIFTARNEERPHDRGDPVDYEKHTSISTFRPSSVSTHDGPNANILIEGTGPRRLRRAEPNRPSRADADLRPGSCGEYRRLAASRGCTR